MLTWTANGEKGDFIYKKYVPHPVPVSCSYLLSLCVYLKKDHGYSIIT